MSIDDEEIERINRKKFEEMLQKKVRVQTQEARKTDGKPIVLTDSTFSSEVSRHPVVVVDFWAPWCAPCRMVGPVIEELARDYSGKVAFGKLNVDENPMTAGEFQVQSIPTILIFRNGQPVDGVLGAVPRSILESKIKPYVGEGNSSNPYR